MNGMISRVGTGLAGVLAGLTVAAQAAEPLLVYVGGTMRPPMERICKMYEEETGQKVEVNYSDSGQIMVAVETTGKGDVCVVHDPFPAAMVKKGVADRVYVPATLTPVIAVPKGNPKGVHGVKDLARPDIKVGLTDAQYSTAGHLVDLIFSKAGLTEAMAKKEIVRARGGGEIANAVKIGTIDAGIVWDAVVFARSDALDAVALEPAWRPQPGVDAVTTATYGVLDMSQVAVAVLTLKTSKQPEAARKLAEFANSERGRKVFLEFGFSAAPPAAAPKLSGSLFVYCAAGVREPVTDLAKGFELEHGIKVEMTVANSGQLLGQIETTRTGDVYIPGDIGFAEKAVEKKLAIGPPRAFCSFTPAIAVRKGNPKGIRDVADLAKAGMRLALADPSAAIGKLQAELLTKNAVDAEAVRKNTLTAPATVTDVALAVKLGTVDAGIIWDAMGAMYPDDLEIVRLPPEKNVISVVTACVLTGARNPAAAEAFIGHLLSAKGRETLQARGFEATAPRD